MKKIIKNLPSFIFVPFVQLLLFCIFLTCKWKVHNVSELQRARNRSKPILICCWHNQFVLVSRYFKKIKLPVWAISSTHRDSEIMATILYKWGFKLIKGSSTRGWSNVLKSMMRILNNKNSIVAITNDGPKGPPGVAKKGSVSLAIKKQAQIIAVSGAATKYYSLPSWDKTHIPKFFSTIHIQFSEPFIKPHNRKEESKEVSDFINHNSESLKHKLTI
ncbi:hypothetical protein CL659_05735 [bacterium]|nr:hypothetical protein [bacterium]|tara:strand:- start:73 stop:726 length:654 start_codon:yes stop_codon:yes gene_type:complete